MGICSSEVIIKELEYLEKSAIDEGINKRNSRFSENCTSHNMTISNNNKTITKTDRNGIFSWSVFEESIPLTGTHDLTLKYTQGNCIGMSIGIVPERKAFY